MLPLLAAFLLAQAPAGPQVDLRSLLAEMLDRDRLARLAEPAFTCAQASSYDRDSVAPDRPGWFANADRSQFVRIETTAGRTEHVLLDAAGPGAVVRFWGTWHGPGGGAFSNGTLRFYLDGAREPAIAGPMADLISGGALVGPPLSDSVSPLSEYERRGHNLYLPIPYAMRCKITYQTDVEIDRGARRGEALYYQINYRTYAPGAEVRTFTRQQLAAEGALVAEVNERLKNPAPLADPRLRLLGFEGALAPGATRTVELTGPGAVRALALRLTAADPAQALRSTVLEIRCDGERTVWCPLGEFFGTGCRPLEHATWYGASAPDGSLSCRWIMPFERSLALTVHNLGEQEVSLSGARVTHGPWQWDARSLHFCASWRQYGALDTNGGREAGAFDVNYVTIDGRGHYVGDGLSVFNAGKAWWGEGDEKIWVDGEGFPSHFGTGTEDYYGYAWCRAEPFSSPFHAQPTGEGNMEPGYSCNARYRILDAIPFAKSLRVDMEMWHWVKTKVDFAPACFWYQRPGGTRNVAADADAARARLSRSREDLVEIVRVPGAIEGEDLAIESKSGGHAEIQDIPQFAWSGDRQLWWRNAKVGDRLVLEFPCAAAGRYRVRANLTKANDYGIVALAVNGERSAGELDRYHPEVAHDLLDLGVFELRAGTNELGVTIAGSNAKAHAAHMFGLDYLLLERAPR